MVRRNPSCANVPDYTERRARSSSNRRASSSSRCSAFFQSCSVSIPIQVVGQLHWQGRGISSFIGKEGEALIPGGRYYCVTCDVAHEIRQ